MGGDTQTAGRATRWLWVILGLGIAWRLVRYGLGMALWGDEAAVGLDIVTRSYQELLRPLGHCQVAPVLFLWGERWMFELLGMSEHAMRLLPLLTGLVGLLFFWKLARLVLEPIAAALAVAIAAISHYIVRHSVELKPYGIDFAVATILLYLAALAIVKGRRRWVWVLVAATPLLMLSSYPAVFVAGAAVVALLAGLSKRTWANLAGVGVFAAVVGLSLLGLMQLSARGQYDEVREGMVAYWKDAFPPGELLAFLVWMLKTHTGNLFAYPVGGKNGASIVGFALFVIGLIAWLRASWPTGANAASSPGAAVTELTPLQRRSLAILFIAPFVLTFAASILHRYPYGESARVSQHLAPAICLLMGYGANVLIERLKHDERHRRKLLDGTMACLLIVGIVGFVGLLIRPYKTWDDEAARRIIRGIAPDANQTIIVPHPPDEVNVNLRWYLMELGDRVRWGGSLAQARSEKALVVVLCGRDVAAAERTEREMGRPAIARERHELQLGPRSAGKDVVTVLKFGPS